jgi:MFS family permease
MFLVVPANEGHLAHRTTQLFEIPSNLLLKKIQPQRYLSLACISWGIVATLTGLTQNFGGLVACRLILGTLESGIFPALTLYLTFFYKRTELGFRLAFIFVSSQSAGAFGGLLGYAIGHMDGIAGMRAWRWIFIIEGIPSVLLGVIVWFGLAPDSDRARYLTAAHKELQKARALKQVGYSEEGERLHWKDVRAAVRDYRTWLFGFGQYGTETMWFGFSTFLPTIIKAIGTWTSIQVQLLTIPCYVLSATAYLIMARVSDHYRLRYIFTMIFLMISIIGYALLMGDVSPGVSYLGCFFVAGGLSVSVALPLVWLPSNMPRYGKRAFGSGLQLTLGAFGGVTAPFVSDPKAIIDGLC